jgi:hypothetical protein
MPPTSVWIEDACDLYRIRVVTACTAARDRVGQSRGMWQTPRGASSMKIAASLFASFLLVWAAALGLAFAAQRAPAPKERVAAALEARFAPPLAVSARLLGGGVRVD